MMETEMTTRIVDKPNLDYEKYNSKKPSHTRRIGTRAGRALLSLLLTLRVTPSDSFVGVKVRLAISQTQSSFNRYSNNNNNNNNGGLFFRNHGSTAQETFPATETVLLPDFITSISTTAAAAASTQDSDSTSTSSDDEHYVPHTGSQPYNQNHNHSQRLPSWLAIQRSHLMEKNLRALNEGMKQSYLFTESEVRRLLYAIEDAAGGDRNLVSGAAEFCLLLADTMEMGLNALIAAAFHYTACYKARSNMLTFKPSQDSADKRHASYYASLTLSTKQLDPYGTHALDIARDAARLKHLEMVAAGESVSLQRCDARNLQHLLLSETKDWRALAIRSGACLFRLRGLLKSAADQQTKTADPPTQTTTAPKRSRVNLTRQTVRVAREALCIYAPLATRLGMHRLKNELEGAAFQILYPRQYNTVTLSAQRPSRDGTTTIEQKMRDVLEKVKDDVTKLLESDHNFKDSVKTFQVTARVKEPYSMWKKMLHRGYTDILQVPDALALRIVLDAAKGEPNEPIDVTRARDRALCYYAQKLCMDHWKPVPGKPRLKDYIKNPKANGYQSLHYTAQTHTTGNDCEVRTLEIQVRSGEMHKVAEFGLASHWDYKERQHQRQTDYDETTTTKVESGFDFIDHSSEAYLRNVQQWHWKQKRVGLNNATDATPASYEPLVLSDIWQSRARSDRIRARTQRLEPYIEALKTAQLDLERDFVFVFLKQQPTQTLSSEHSSSSHPEVSNVLALPSGACVLDALREGAKSFGLKDGNYQTDWINTKEGSLALNGESVSSVTIRLQNGDILTVPKTTRQQLSVPELANKALMADTGVHM